MKRRISLLAALVMACCLTFAAAGAEEDVWVCSVCGTENIGAACEACGEPRSEKLTYEQEHTVRAALICALQMKARAMNGTWTEEQQRWADSIAAIDAAHPRAGALLVITPETKEALKGWLGEADYFWPDELNKKLNRFYSESYGDVAGRIAVSTGTEIFYEDFESMQAVLLVYDQNLVLSWVEGGFSVNGLCLIGSESVAEQFGDEYMQQMLASIGLQGTKYFLFPDAAAVEAIKDDAVMPLYHNEDEMAEAVAATNESILAMLPEMYETGLFTNVSTAPTIILHYLKQHSPTPAAAMEAVRFVHEQLEPIVDAHGYGKPGYWKEGVYLTDDETLLALSGNWSPPAELEGGETDAEANESPLKDGDKILAVHRQTTASGSVTVEIQYFLQACMDEQYNPGTPEDADWILLVDTHWEEGDPHGNIRLFKAVSVVTLNDAKTGKAVMNVCTRKDGAYGMITVYGNSYYQKPRLEGLWKEIAPVLFPGTK